MLNWEYILDIKANISYQLSDAANTEIQRHNEI